ncbi:hypothetical protein PPERSA_01976 [Pseudocohnilembus persalinus]|uniref:Uncharacterized protein n=1 Tax=Pseudocohnilembus persalinus TaxID=266149 RepID=A0A0V0QF43_PSEPJ|nr:hypothetical protein PPERSA_01976 [Pseudocohnilembus persalinus]|eukprot:KRX00797.1 hypothetical protein PPERSA_01976 [Pseudocohnilembus persalinus]
MQKINQQEYMNCPKKDHDGSPFIFFKFTENINEMLQCVNCNAEDIQVDKKIAIDKLMNMPIWKVQNFPPLRNQKNKDKIKQIMENFNDENCDKFKLNIIIQIEEQFVKIKQDLNQILHQLKKDTILQFEQFFYLTNISEYYNVEPLKKFIGLFQEKKINLETLFTEQLKMKVKFDGEEKEKLLLNQEKVNTEILNQIQILKQQLDQKTDQFRQQILLGKDFLNQFQKEMLQAQQKQQQIEKDTFLNYRKNMQNFQEYQEIEMKKENIQMHMADKFYCKKCINIANDDFLVNICLNKCQNKTHDSEINTLCTNVLDFQKTYKFKMEINLFNQKHGLLKFGLIGTDQKIQQQNNQATVNLISYNPFKKNNKLFNFLLKQSVLNDDKIIINVVFNYREKLLQLFDDKNNEIENTFLYQNMIIGQLIFYMQVQFQQKIDISILEVNSY